MTKNLFRAPYPQHYNGNQVKPYPQNLASQPCVSTRNHCVDSVTPQKTIVKQHSGPQNLVYIAYCSYNGNQAKSYLQNIAYFA